MTRYNSRKTSKYKFTKVIAIALIVSFLYIFISGNLHVKVLNASENNNEKVKNYFVLDSAEEIKLEDLLKPDSKSVLFFTSSWCSSCRYTSSILRDSSKGFSDITFYEVDLDSHRALAAEFDAEFVSQFVFIENEESKLVKDLSNDNIQTSINLFENTGIFAL